MSHSSLREKLLSKSVVKAIYSELDPEYSLLRQMLKARQKAGLSQAEVAELMGTKAPAVTRLESSLGNGKHSPSLATLQKYAKAVGCQLQVKFVRA
jgi:transcriptional regulator with XRE-family HTH domain